MNFKTLKKNSKYIIFSLIFLIILITIFAYSYFTVPHYHAEFHVYKGGEKIDLAGLENMYFAPCRVYDFGERELEEIDRAHLHDYVGDIVHVHDDGVTWRVLLSNLNIEGDLIGYNKEGQLIENLLDRVIIPYESVVFSDTELENIEDLVPILQGTEYVKKIETTAIECEG